MKLFLSFFERFLNKIIVALLILFFTKYVYRVRVILGLKRFDGDIGIKIILYFSEIVARSIESNTKEANKKDSDEKFQVSLFFI